jgi:mannosyltransferase OCH1-like enzyme
MNNINNIKIIADNKDTTNFDYDIKYIDEYNFEIVITFIFGSNLNLKILNKYGDDEIDISFTETDNNKIVNSPFKLLLNDSEFIGKIPKIIHQSHTDNLSLRLKNATYTWKLMNNDYKYMYWTNELSDKYIYENCDEMIKEAYFSLYERSYKLDILRLCILYEFGGLWSDIFSECIDSIDKIINDEINIVIVKDNLCQSFIAVEPKNDVIKYILDFTVNRVLNFNKYNDDYHWIKGDINSVTGSTIFSIGLNRYLDRNPNSLISDEFIQYNSNKILLLDHKTEYNIRYIFKNDSKIIRTKYENYQKDISKHNYSKYFDSGYIIKKKLPETNINNIKKDSRNLFQIWINNDKYGSNYISEKMYYCYNTWVEKNPELNYIFLDNNSIIELFKRQREFPHLLEAYNKIKAFAFKADLARYYLMYKFSGTYVDIDSYCINNINELTDGFDLVLSYDQNKTEIQQAFIYSRNPKLDFFKQLINICIINILVENTDDGDLGITGPKLFGRIAQQVLGYLDKESEFSVHGLKIKIINYYLNLPLPKGCWINSSIKYKVDGYILTALCKSQSGYIENKVTFVPRDTLKNINGFIKGNTKASFSFSKGSGFFIYNDRIYIVSKYAEYNEERHILGGNDFAEMYENNDIF